MASYWRHAPWTPWLLSACIETKNDDGDDGDENKKAKDTKKCFIKSELKLEYYKNCWKTSQLEKELNHVKNVTAKSKILIIIFWNFTMF